MPCFECTGSVLGLSDPNLLELLESLSLVCWFLDVILAVYGKFEGSLPNQCRLGQSPQAGVLCSIS